MGPSSLQSFIPWLPTKQIPEEATLCSAEVRAVSFLCTLPHCPKDYELHQFIDTAANAALELQIPHQPLLVVESPTVPRDPPPPLVGEDKVQHSPLSRWFLCCLEKEVIVSAFQGPPVLLVLCYVVRPTDSGKVEAHHEDQVL